MERLLDNLGRRLAELPNTAHRYAVAFSGGMDSTVLLAALQRLTPRQPLRALHIDHGLHPESASWERHCRSVADSLGVGYESRRCPVAEAPGQSLEARAREVRYGMLAELMAPGETLLTAHHADDQLETILLRLLRGSGVKGLRGIAGGYEFGSGYLARPLLRVPRDEILEVARAWELEWIEDPSNRDLRFDRNFVRAELAPRMKSRWPAAERTVGRAARQMADAHEILEDIAGSDAQAIDNPACIRCAALLEISPPRRRNLLRHLIGRVGLPVPDSRQMATLLKALDVQRPDARTRVQWPGAEARTYRGRLYLFPPLCPGSADGYSGPISRYESWSGPEGKVSLVPGTGPGLPAAWAAEGFRIRFRMGGERFKPLRRSHSRPLKKWLQEAGVPPWLRTRIPLLYRSNQLVAVGDLWVSAAVEGITDSEGAWQVRWTDHPPLV